MLDKNHIHLQKIIMAVLCCAIAIFSFVCESDSKTESINDQSSPNASEITTSESSQNDIKALNVELNSSHN